MKTIAGKTEHVVVVGAGLSGLSAALHLRGTGRSVTVVEQSSEPGGRVGAYAGPDNQYRIDSGATVLTMPDLIDDALRAVGTDRDTVGLHIRRMDPAYHARYADGTSINVHSDPEAMEAEVRRVCGDDEAARYRQLRTWLQTMFETEFDRFIASNFDSPLDLMNSSSAARDMTKLVALGGFSRLGRQVAKRIHDPRLQRIFTFQALYAGMPPAKALGVYGAIAHMDTSLGVYYPDGGMHNITKAMAEAFVNAGGTLKLDTAVTSLEAQGTRVAAAITEHGDRISGDSFVLTADLPIVDALLAPTSARRPRRRLRWSPSAFILHGTVPQSVSSLWDAQAHHTIDFGDAWDTTFKELTARRGKGRVMSDPSLLITRPVITDPGLAVANRHDHPDSPGAHELLSILAPTPNLESAPLDWDKLGPAYRDELLGVLENRGYKGIAEHFVVDHVDSPGTWLRQGMGAGTPFSAAHTFPQTGPFRRRNLVKGIDNVVLSGCGTTPGVGVPTTIISGKLAARRITG
ncbi:phytoene desaturase [Hoyosella rhizosphaerae]|uniref:Phytoene dehydrogenase n=1 Tax=Hoyosella rhizosphaerae TaxID=1755582 RepID=A0A916UG14_9ACTN|nr:phytoene desaturase family protein [Hoyosella rhizosphaerae]MBN4927932.1 phytoene desaturase [Hoyosella rhizosphaerae]GGC71080.1 phytoene dehydrogenase [Hoyosella rhizosphaerae]